MQYRFILLFVVAATTMRYSGLILAVLVIANTDALETGWLANGHSKEVWTDEATNKPAEAWPSPTKAPPHPTVAWPNPTKAPPHPTVAWPNPTKAPPHPAVVWPNPTEGPKNPIIDTAAVIKDPSSNYDIKPINFDNFFPTVEPENSIPIETIIRDDKWREWVLKNPIKRPIYPPVYEPPTDIPPNPFAHLSTDETTAVPYYTEKPVTQGPYTGKPTQRPYTEEPVTKLPIYTDSPIAKRPTIYQLIKLLTFNRFLHLIDEAGLAEHLTGSGPVTVFVPSNEAFEKLPYSYIEQLATKPEVLKAFLLHHIVKDTAQTIGNLPSYYLKLVSAAGHPLHVLNQHNLITVNGVTVLKADLIASNGVFHVISESLYPFLVKGWFDLLKEQPQYSIFVDLLTITRLPSTLHGSGPYTIFAPTNAAFEKLDPATLQWLKDDRQRLKEFLQRYIASGLFYSTYLKNGDIYPALFKNNQYSLVIGKDQDGIRVNKIAILKADILAANGVIHSIGGLNEIVIKKNLLQVLQSQGELTSYFIKALTEVGLVDDHLTSGGPFTVFVPTTEAFKSIDQATLEWLFANPGKLRKILLNYFVKDHIYYNKDLTDGLSLTSISGTEIKISGYGDNKLVNKKKIVLADIIASNGIVHLIDGTFFDIFTKNLFETLKIENEFNTFIWLLEKAGLVDDHLKNGGPFTVFAPSDKALESIDKGILIWLSKNPQLLREFLLKHFVKGFYYSNSLTDGLQLTSIQKTPIKVTKNKDGIYVNDKTVIRVDIHTTNGVIHVVDDFIFDVSIGNLLEVLQSQGEKSKIFLEALKNAGLIDDHLKASGPFTVFVPTDQAFRKIDPVTLKWLLWDPENLKALVLKHFVRNRIYYDDLLNGVVLTALGNKAQLSLSGPSGDKKVNNALISDYDHVASNGVIHFIDEVLFSSSLKKPQ